jgi:hypothetical protein
VGCYEDGNEILSFVKSDESLDQNSDYQLLKEDSGQRVNKTVYFPPTHFETILYP